MKLGKIFVQTKYCIHRYTDCVTPCCTCTHGRDYDDHICVGNIYAMDFDLVNNVVYYGDRNASSIWKVSINRLTPLQDDRTLILSNATAWDISYDWMNGYIYWTDDV